ncbi:MAG: pyridoxamine 5'-phosphate oxidase family protein [Euryarchaeota archaeon]|nr:pyridoxamine 5'-phosphate oxidase family protein [Euryarchaeota archaeon]
MRRAEKEIKDREVIDSILRRAVVCRIAMCDGDEPYIVPMSFGYRNGCIYLHSAREGKKVDILRRNNKVSFEVDIDVKLGKGGKACKWGMNYLSIVGFGRASFIENRDEKKEGLDAIMEHYSGVKDHEYAPDVFDRTAVIKIEIEAMTGKNSGY